MSLTPGARFGAYEVLALLGVGGMGEVYRARDTRLKREVALKVLPDAFSSNPDRLARFQREAELLATLNHPNIAAVYGLEESGDTRAIVMELVEGPTLSEMLAASGRSQEVGRTLSPQEVGRTLSGPPTRSGAPGTPDPIGSGLHERRGLPLDEALAIARQIAAALEAAHDKGVVHRDLKPANIKVTPEGTVKVLDFGLAKLAEVEASSGMTNSPTLSFQATRAGVILGTAAYMSPEQARGKVVDRKTDIWAFGCVFHETLSGRQCFDPGETVSDAVAAILKNEPDWSALPADTPAHVRALLRRCLQKDPQKRLPHIGVARLELEESPGEAPAMQLAAAPPVRSGLKTGPYGWIAAVLLLGVSAALGAVIVTHREPADVGSVRVTVSPPEGWTLGHNLAQRGTNTPAPHVAVSPDGRRLAYVMYGTGKPQLWVKRLDAADGQPLPNTDDAAFPFWSADGRFVAFFASGKLRRIDASGGPPQTVCDAPAGEGGSWNLDGDIVFAPDSGGPLFRVSAAGGIPTPLTMLDATTNELSHRWPQFLPDGRRFVFLAGASGADLFVSSLDSPERTLVMEGAERALYASGHLLFVRDGTLMAQPFDPEALLLSGEPVPVAEDVAMNAGNHRTAFSVSAGGVLAFRSGGAVAARPRQITRFDRSGKQVEVVGSPAGYRNLRVAPGDASLVVRINETATSGDWWILDLTRGGLATLFTSGAGGVGSAFWSPDGARIVFGSGRPVADWYQKSTAGGGEQTLLLKTAFSKGWGDWSEPAQHIIYSETKPGTSLDLWALSLAKDAQPRVFLQSEFVEDRPRFSPDGRWVAYMSNESGTNDVYVRAFPSGDRKVRVSVTGGDAPVWRRDGRELFYYQGSKVMAVDVRTGADFESGTPRELFDLRRPVALTGDFEALGSGQQFLIAEPLVGSAPEAITLVVNWPALLTR